MASGLTVIPDPICSVVWSRYCCSGSTHLSLLSFQFCGSATPRSESADAPAGAAAPVPCGAAPAAGGWAAPDGELPVLVGAADGPQVATSVVPTAHTSAARRRQGMILS